MSLASVGALVVSAAGVGIAVLATGSASAQTQPTVNSRFKPVPADLTAINKPLGASDAVTTVVVQLAGDPVTVIDANSATPLTDSQRNARRDQIRAAQKPAESQVTALGGKVLGSYQLSYNGLKVSIPANKASQLLSIPNVVAVHQATTVTPANTHGVPLIGAPAVWDGLNGFHGEGIKVAIIDTGIDYTHADFGGPGTPADYTAAHANETAPANPSLFGPGAPKVKGGTDLVGDSYNADPSSASFQPTPHPDPNPLDCNGHGTHVAGTSVGFGVTADGHTYTGPYNATTVSGNSWIVGPGVAPKASLYSVRVFGCEGSADTSVIVDAIEWAVAHHMDVISMSLGSTWSDGNAPDAVASDNAAKDGVIVVAAAGNDGFASPYMVGSPANSTSAIAVAAIDPTPSFPGVSLSLSTGPTLSAINANGWTPLPSGPLPVVVLPDDGVSPTGIGQGCTFDSAGNDTGSSITGDLTGKIVVTARGVCARVARAIYGQMAGAAAVIMVNSANSFPPFEGPISGNPDPGAPGQDFDVTIPFLGVSQADADALKAVGAASGTITLAQADLDNPSFLGAASFTSGGPRIGDSFLKPDVAAPGVSIASAASGTGNGFIIESGTSMATPHTSGAAALVKQAHPSWKKVDYYKAAIVNTADPTKVNGYVTSIEGAGLVQVPGAAATQVVALGDKGTATLNYGFAELGGNYVQSKTITLVNLGSKSATFNVSDILSDGAPHTVTLSTHKVTVKAHNSTKVTVKLSVPASSAPTGTGGFGDVAGLVQFTPTTGSNAGVSLRVPYYLVPQTVSNLSTSLNTGALVNTGTATATVTNHNGATTGAADWYAWGLKDGKDKGLGSTDVKAVGVQTFPGDDFMAFAIAGEQRWSQPASKEFDILIDSNGDGTDDFDAFGTDLGLVTTGLPTGQVVSGVLDLSTGDISLQFFGDAPYDSSTLVLGFQISSLGLSEANPRFTYHVESFDLTDSSISDTVDGTASFNAFAPSISTGFFDVVDPNGSAQETVSYNATEFAQTPALGLMIVTHDNRSDSEAQLIALSNGHGGHGGGHGHHFNWPRLHPRSGQAS